MTCYAVVIADAEVARDQEVERNKLSHAIRPGMSEQHIDKIRASLRKLGQLRPVGTLASMAYVECPDGMVNCRNCGDPEHAATCKAAGHCPHCGTRHGIAPTRIVAENGYELVEIDGFPGDDQMWDAGQQRFVARSSKEAI